MMWLSNLWWWLLARLGWYGDSLYFPAQKQIFHYYDGAKVVHSDPIDIWQKLMDVGADLSVDIKIARSDSKNARKAQEDADQTLRGVFSIKPVPQGGLSRTQLLNLLTAFNTYCTNLKKNSPPRPTTPPPTEASTVSQVAVPPTENTAASGSTVSDISIGSPGPSTLVPEPPSGSVSLESPTGKPSPTV